MHRFKENSVFYYCNYPFTDSIIICIRIVIYMNYDGINQAISKDKVESLRLILEQVYGGSISLADAEDIADNLLGLYKLLETSDTNMEVEMV